MDFAKKELTKYGWSEGEGLGKNRDGISKALKPRLKFDSAGLGHDAAEEFTNPWWERVYNDAANNLVTKKKKDTVMLDTKEEESVEICVKKKRKKSKRKDDGEEEQYKGFIKTSELDGSKETRLYKRDHSDEEEKCELDMEVRDISNEYLLKICRGRTVHKGARHGLKMRGKLARIQEHEEECLRTLNKRVMDYERKVEEVVECGLKKKKKKRKILKEKD